jgi:hypothetical protein
MVKRPQETTYTTRRVDKTSENLERTTSEKQ